MLFAEKEVDENRIREIIENVFIESPGIDVITFRFSYDPDENIDLIATIEFGDQFIDLLILIGSSGEPRILKSKIMDLMSVQKSGYLVYMAPYISKNSRAIIMENDVGFIDFSGNAYISFDNVLISRTGYENKFKKKRMLKKIFSKRSTRIIRKLLSSYGKEWKITELANEAQVSSGFVSIMIRNLAEEGYIDRKWGSIKLIKPGELLDKWAEEYRFDRQNTVGYYCPYKERDQIFQKLREIHESNYALTMGAAASVIAPHVRSTDIYIYSTDSSFMIDKLDLTPVEFGGNIYLTTPADIGVFFDKQYIEGLSIVSNIQLYIDLFNYPARGREQAEFLRESVMEI
jgi:transcriptional regulator with AbiEi antitoxin domain of type IV toxin-antitoxin system